MENTDYKRNNRTMMVLIVLLAGLLVYWGSTGRRINTDLALAANKKIEVSKEVTNLQDSFSAVADAAKPATVNISVIQIMKLDTPYYDFYYGDPLEDFFQEFFGSPDGNRQPNRKQQYRKSAGTGSGVIIDPKGIVLTNYHVIEGADQIKVTLSDGKTYDGKVIGKDQRTDLAVVKMNSKEPFTSLALGDSDGIRIGDWAIAIGSPFGLEQTVTAGIISAKRQSLNIEGKTFRELIQTDASINRGNSGGPLLNIKGEVIGINTAIYAPTGVFAGIGFAIPINKAKEIIGDLIEKGKVVRGWLGIEINDVNDVIAKNFKLSDKSGALVNGVIEGSAAERGGLKRGDIIVEFNGQKIKDSLNLQDIVGKTQPGKKAKVGIMRNGGRQSLDIELGEMPSEQAASGAQEKAPAPAEEKGGEEPAQWEGMEVKPLTSYLAQQFEIDGKEAGVVVTAINGASKSAELGIQVGDLIKAVDRNRVTNIADFKKAMKQVKLSDGVMFDIVRRGRPLYITYAE